MAGCFSFHNWLGTRGVFGSSTLHKKEQAKNSVVFHQRVKKIDPTAIDRIVLISGVMIDFSRLDCGCFW